MHCVWLHFVLPGGSLYSWLSRFCRKSTALVLKLDWSAALHSRSASPPIDTDAALCQVAKGCIHRQCTLCWFIEYDVCLEWSRRVDVQLYILHLFPRNLLQCTALQIYALYITQCKLDSAPCYTKLVIYCTELQITSLCLRYIQSKLLLHGCTVQTTQCTPVASFIVESEPVDAPSHLFPWIM